MQLAVRSSSLRGWLPVQATHNGGGGRGQTTSLPKRKREERRGGGKKLLICATWTNEEGRQMQTTEEEGGLRRWRKRAPLLAAVPLRLRRCSAVLTRGKALETFGHTFGSRGWNFSHLEVPNGAPALGERGGTWVPRGWRRCPGTEVPSCPFRDPAEMGSACPI